MQETTIVFITLLLLLIITCIFGGSMRQTPVVVSQYPPTNMGGSYGLPMEQFNEEEGVDEDDIPNNEDIMGGGGPMEVQMDETVEGMENNEEEDELVNPQPYISEEFASY